MSSVQKEIILIPTGTIWKMLLVATQPVGVPASMGIQISIPEGERGLLMTMSLGPDNYGAGRAVSASIINPSTVEPLYVLGNDSVDNQKVTIGHTLVSTDLTSSVIGTIGVPYMPFILTEDMIIRIVGASLANAETLSAVLYIATRVSPPVATVFGASVTLTTETITQV